MAIRIVHRPARTVYPPPQRETHEVEAPPTLPDGGAQANPLMTILPMVGMMASLTIMMALRNPAFMALGALVLVVAVVAAVGMLFSRRGQAARQRRNQRELYLEYLEELREDLGKWEQEARSHARQFDPPPEALYDVARDPTRMWERRRKDRDFLRLRAGTGVMPGRPLRVAEKGTALAPTDPFMLSEARTAVRRFETVPDMPFTVPLDMVGNVSVIGERADVMRLVRALIAQFGAFHVPEDAALAVMHPRSQATDWEWLKWLPHVFDQHRRDGGVNARLIAPSSAKLGAMLSDELRARTERCPSGCWTTPASSGRGCGSSTWPPRAATWRSSGDRRPARRHCCARWCSPSP